MDNIQVIERAFGLLEAVARDSSRPHTLTELIQLSGLKPATTARIVKTLANLGYLEQLGRKTGYTLGRKTFELTRDGDFVLPLLQVAKPLMQEFSDLTGEYICLSALRDGQRVILHHLLSTRPVQISGQTVTVETPYRSLSGRVLLAHLSEEEQRHYWRKNGIPGPVWPEITDEEGLVRALAEIRRQCRAAENNGELASIAVPIRDGDRVPATLGVYLPTYRNKGEHRKTILKLLDNIPPQIVTRLQAPRSPRL